MQEALPQDQAIELAAYQNIPESRRTYDIVSKVAFLIGAKQTLFEREPWQRLWYDRLQSIPEARVIRSLCKIRTGLLKHYQDIDYNMRYQIRNLDKMTNLFDMEDFVFLNAQGIFVLKVNYRINAYIADINRLIAQHIHACRDVFPIWLKWEYIRDLFLMPGGIREACIISELNWFKEHITSYPYRLYLYWRLMDKGNILLNDGKFVQLLYIAHRDKFTDLNMVMDAGEGVKDSLYHFLCFHQPVVMVVDCENSDPYKLCATLRKIEADRNDAYANIERIILYDDIRAASAWRMLENYVSIPIQHEMVERIHDNKSLVDMRMAAGICKEYYLNQTIAFLLVSSDSDYWGLIAALPTVPFLVMTEYEKCGERLMQALERAGIPYCFLDDFCGGNISDIKIGTLISEIKEYTQSCIQLNINTMLGVIFDRTRVSLTPAEMKNFYDKFIKTMRLSIDDDGEANIVVGG